MYYKTIKYKLNELLYGFNIRNLLNVADFDRKLYRNNN